MAILTTRFIAEPIPYDGRQLRSHWIYDSFEILGDAIVAFTGPCHVKTEDLVDTVDRRKSLPISSEAMVHWIGEFFTLDLDKTILWQRLIIGTIGQTIARRTGRPLAQTGNDLFDQDRKLNVAIATLSPISTLFHIGLNISSRGTPVPTRGLEDYGIDPPNFAQSILEEIQGTWRDVAIARAKVRGVT